MQFTSDSGGSKTIGIGQFRDVGGTTAVQMQMVSGPSGGPYTTHWAYMLPYDPDTFTPPDPLPNADITSTQWAWTIDTRWMFQSDSLFGPGGVGSFTITDYRNGYFWGSGEGPAGSPGESFTQLGSITPEGNVLFNVLDGSGNLISLTGLVTGDRWNGRMALRTYEFSGSDPSFGPIGIAVVLIARAPLGRVVAETARGAWRASAVTLAFVVMAEVYVGSGMATAIAEALRGAAGRGAAASVPLFAAVGGFLTGGG